MKSFIVGKTPCECLVERVTALFFTKLSKKWRMIITPIAAIAILSVFLFFPREQNDNTSAIVSGKSPVMNVIDEEPTIAAELPADDPLLTVLSEPAPIVVDIRGAVKYPGVYSLLEGDRLIDAINAAGGYLPDAQTKMLNHAMKVHDEFFIYVLREGEEVEPLASVGLLGQHEEETAVDESTVNINLANMQELMTIPGIGPSKATAILEYREEHGPFQTVESIMEVSGIGQKTFDKLKTYISVN